MSTVGALIDRIFREFLHPLDDFPSSVPLKTTITDSDTSVVYEDGYLTVEEEDMLDQGSKFQLGRELMMASAINTSTQTLTVPATNRGILGTTAAAATAGDFIYIDPPYTRQAVYDAVTDGIGSLQPMLYRVGTEEVWHIGWPQEINSDAFEIIDSRYQENGRWEKGGGGTLVEGDPDASTGKSVQLNWPYGRRNYVRYKRAFGSVTDETTTLASIGLTTEMHYPLMLEAVARVMATVDIKPATQEYISQMLESQGFPPQTGEKLRNSLLNYRELLVRRIAEKLVTRDNVDVEVMTPYPGAQLL